MWVAPLFFLVAAALAISDLMVILLCTDSAGHAPVLRYPRANRQRPCAGAILGRACRVLGSGSIRLCRYKPVELPRLLGKIRTLVPAGSTS